MRISKKYIFISIAVILVLLIAGGIFAARKNSKKLDESSVGTVTRGSVKNDIELSGTVEAEHSATFGFESTGVLRSSPFKVGDTVQEGQILATIDSQTSELELARATADRASQGDGTSVSVESARSALTLVESENAATLELRRQAVRNAKKDLDQTKAVWEQAVREDGDEASITQSKYSLVVSAEGAYRTAQQTLKTAEKTAASAVDAAKAKVKAAEVADAASYQASLHTSGLSSLEASEAIAKVRLSKTVIRAPWTGVITDKKVEAGEVAVAGSGVVSMQTIDTVEVIAYVPETDIISLTVGMPATIELEAFGPDKTWDASIYRIDPIATELEGVPTYKTYFRLNTAEAQFRPGFSATVIVHSAERNNVLSIPRRAVQTKDGKTVVYLIGENDQPIEQTVTTGLAGSDGSIEIISGLQEGQRIFTRLPDGTTQNR